MSLVPHYLQTATELCRQYDAAIPFQPFLKQFFSQHKKYGSRDRKMISGLCYGFFRLGKAVPDMETEERIKLGWFLAAQQPNRLLQEINSEWNAHATDNFAQKLALLHPSFRVNEIAAFDSILSSPLNATDYAAHFLEQPDVFVRVRPGNMPVVLQKLKQLNWEYHVETESAIRLPASSAIDAHFDINRELVVQDLNSQRVGEFISSAFKRENFIPVHIWDCCAASGGKSIMLKDIYPKVELTVSDIRSSILHNLRKRFQEAGIQHYQAFEADLVQENQSLQKKRPAHLKCIVADVPCTGSGTWSRTPEQLYFFKEAMVEEYAEKQLAIAGRAQSYLDAGGYLIYITCSVFQKENEENVGRLMQQYPLELIGSTLLDGTRQKADSMYVAVLRKNALSPY